MKSNNSKKIFVGVSGGVDSSVTAALLKEQGHDVVGVFIRTWQPDWIECTWKQERRDAIRVCAHLDIPFVELDMEKEYKEGVADYMITEYKKGRTPNPDVMCNREVKFGGFLRWAMSHGADYVATGHYARTITDSEDVSLARGVDASKDQSYFLWTLEASQLQNILFPVGELQKSEVREEAKRFNLPTAMKKDSQGICFIGEIDMKDFLGKYIDEKKGDIQNTKGEVIGSHTGVLFYTIGERHGLSINAEHKGVNDTPYYVVDKNLDSNTLIVSQNPKEYDVNITSFELVDVVDNGHHYKEGVSYSAQIRYHGDILQIKIDTYDANQSSMNITFSKPVSGIAAGQSVVIYKDNICCGGGIIN